MAYGSELEADDVIEAGLLRDAKVGRQLLFVNHEFLDALTRPE